MASGSGSNSDSVFGSTTPKILYRYGMDVTLLYHDIGEVGFGFIPEAQPIGDWSGIHVPQNNQEFVLLRPSEIIPLFSSLPLFPHQVGISVISHKIDKTIHWRVVNLIIPPDAPTIIDDDEDGADVPFNARSQWVGHEVLRKVDNRGFVASRRINCYFPNDLYHDGTLGKDCVGVTVLQLMIGDIMSVMTHPLLEKSASKSTEKH